MNRKQLNRNAFKFVKRYLPLALLTGSLTAASLAHGATPDPRKETTNLCDYNTKASRQEFVKVHNFILHQKNLQKGFLDLAKEELKRSNDITDTFRDIKTFLGHAVKSTANRVEEMTKASVEQNNTFSETPSTTAAPFEITQNDGLTLKIRIHPMTNLKMQQQYFFTISNSSDSVGIPWTEDGLGQITYVKKYPGLFCIDLSSGLSSGLSSNSSGGREISLSIQTTGNHNFTFYRKNDSAPDKRYDHGVLWSQNVFVIPKAQLPAENIIGDLAKKFSPVVVYHSKEKFRPTSLNYLFNRNPETDSQKKLSRQMVYLQIDNLGKGYQFPFSQIEEVMSKYGDSSAVLNTKPAMDPARTDRDTLAQLMFARDGRSDQTIHYSLIPSVKNKKIYYLNYHFLYTFDTKTVKETASGNSKRNIAEHIFDRESVTLVLEQNGAGTNENEFTPIQVVYGAHLAGQEMNLLDINGNNLDAPGASKQRWNTGSIGIPWADAAPIRFKDTHIMAFIAQGSHGVYPVPGVYSITLANTNTLNRLLQTVVNPDQANNFTARVQKATALLVEEAGVTRDGKPLPVAVDPSLFETFTQASGSLAPSSNQVTLEKFKLENLSLDQLQGSTGNRALIFSGSTVDILGPQNATFPPFTERESNADQWVASAFKPAIESDKIPKFSEDSVVNLLGTLNGLNP